MTFDANKFSRLISFKRNDLRLSLRGLGKQIEVSASTISRLERGAIPDIDSFFKVSDWLGIKQFDQISIPK